jgi:O-acetyl-ADP-ribose deacetylase (regulator of RNase III)
MPLKFVRQDITRMKVDAIVNAANTRLMNGGGVCGAIFQAAGPLALAAACAPLAPCGVGQAVCTEGFALPAKHIIHTVGPVWEGGMVGEVEQLRDCYANSLKLAAQHGWQSVAFPLIASGIFGYPKEQAMQVAVTTIREFLQGHEMLVYLVFYDEKATLIGMERFADVTRYIDDRYVQTHTFARGVQTGDVREAAQAYSKALSQAPELLADSEFSLEAPILPAPGKESSVRKGALRQRRIQDVVAQLEESFSECLLRLIDEKGFTDVEAYKRANMDRKLFSKIRGNRAYSPKKATALAFAIALRLSIDETRDLLQKAGFALSNSSRFDLIVAYCLENGILEIDAVNELLFEFKEPLLGV